MDNQPYVVVVECRDYPHPDLYHEEIESWKAIGYQRFCALAAGQNTSFTVLYNKEVLESDKGVS